MVVQFLSNSSLIAYIRYFKQILKVNNDNNIKRFLEQCETELSKRK